MTTKNYYKTLKTLFLSIFMGCSVLNTQAQIYVDASATNGANNGTTWNDAYTDLQPALNADPAGTEIRVASRTYKPTEKPDNSDQERRIAFHFDKNLLLKGSYNPAKDAQDFAKPSILSGDFNGNDVITGSGSSLSITGNSENALHVLITADLTAATRIEGFLITGGNANGSGNLTYSGKAIYANHGGGMYNIRSSPSIVNTVFSGNSAIGNGGGMFNGTASPSIVNTVFSGNKADVGAGMHQFSSSPMIVNSTFSGNSATTEGGGINNSVSTPTIYNSVFYGNNGSDLSNANSTKGGNNFSENFTHAGFTALSADPFLDSENPKGADGDWFTTDDGLQPSSATSPITDAGDATKLPSYIDGDTTKVIPFDITGRTRIAGATVDVGAYEHGSVVLSVKEIDSNKLNIYSTGHKTLVIHGVLDAKTTANVYSLQDKLVASKTFNKFSTSNSLDVSTLSTGIYIVKMHNAKHQVHTKKLFIQ
ncbi:T9SS type A sorting domain-containing protein [Polaribacter sp.]|nr:T9SS type A sorting domain-containing protein [Polaribacter sp.]MDB4241375.1 T9SS type A sorting domain-containing protein [Polaribacter sp.]